jgi:hypothetical protein
MTTITRTTALAAALVALAGLQGCVVLTLGTDGELKPVAPATVAANPGLLLGQSKAAETDR